MSSTARIFAGSERSSVLALSGGQEDQRRELLRRLTVGRSFTSQFIITYQVVVIIVVLLFTAWHSYEQTFISRRSRLLEQVASEERVDQTRLLNNHDASSRLRKDDVDIDEETSLMAYQTRAAQARPSMWLRARSLLMYQPRAIPIINKAFPENATTVLILCLLGLNLFYALYNIEWELPLMLVWADRTGLCFAANLPWLYLLGAKNQPLRRLTGYSYEHLNILHRRLGEWLCFLALLHSGGMMSVWFIFFRPLGRSLGWFLTEKTVLLGLITLACYETLYMTSLASFRRWWYELFLATHVVLQAGALVFLWFHHKGSRVYVGAALGVFMVDRIVFRLFLKSRSVIAQVRILEDGNTVMLNADWPAIVRAHSRRLIITRNNIISGWEPSQHVFVTAPTLGYGHTTQAHPFTIASSSPFRQPEYEDARLSLIIRAQDGFTKDLLLHAQQSSALRVRLDGPYGSTYALDMLRCSDVCLLVAGGSGIAVAHPMLCALLQADGHRPSATITSRKVGLIWIVHETSHFEWLGHEWLARLGSLGLHIVLPPATSKAGRPDVAALVTGTIEELMDGRSIKSRIGVVVSGPDSMNRVARNTCSRLAWEGRDVTVSVEKFGW